MVYVELKGFLADTFKGRGNEIMQEAMSRLGIVDIDRATDAQKKKFADYLLKHHLNYSPQKNRFIYDQLLNTMGIGSLFDLKEYRQTVEVEKKQDSVVLSSLESYWGRIKREFAKYEVIMNLYWLKGVDAEAKGMDKTYVKKVIYKSLISIKNESDAAFMILLDELDLSKYARKHRRGVLKIRLFDDMVYPNTDDEPDEETRYILENVTLLKYTVDKSIADMKEIMLDSLDSALEVRLSHGDENAFMEDLRSKIIKEWEFLKSQHEEVKRKFQERFKLSL